jgi:hypothetical protein
MLFERTLKTLDAQRQAHEQQLAAIRKFERELGKLDKVSEWMIFEVHFQCYDPCHCPVATVGHSLGKTYEAAVKLWRIRNGKTSHPGHGRAEVLLCSGDLRIVIKSVDAATIANSDGDRLYSSDEFGADVRLIEKVGKIVWNKKDEQLHGWYSDRPVPAEEVEAAVAVVTA